MSPALGADPAPRTPRRPGPGRGHGTRAGQHVAVLTSAFHCGSGTRAGSARRGRGECRGGQTQTPPPTGLVPSGRGGSWGRRPGAWTLRTGRQALRAAISVHIRVPLAPAGAKAPGSLGMRRGQAPGGGGDTPRDGSTDPSDSGKDAHPGPAPEPGGRGQLSVRRGACGLGGRGRMEAAAIRVFVQTALS